MTINWAANVAGFIIGYGFTNSWLYWQRRRQVNPQPIKGQIAMNLGQVLLDKKRALSRQHSKNKAQGAPFWCWPLALMNRIVGRLTGQRLLISQGKAYWLQDEPRSCTLEVLQFEAASGFYEPPLQLRPGDTVIDLGAHVGGFVIPLAKKYPQTRFVSYEPDEKNFKNLVYNLARHRAVNVLPWNCGIASEDCLLEMHHDDANTGASTSTEFIKFDAIKTSEVTKGPLSLGLSLEEILHLNNKCRLLKIDVEGAEHRAITSASSLLHVESLLAEVHADIERGWNPWPTIEYMRKVPVHRISVEPGPHRIIAGE